MLEEIRSSHEFDPGWYGRQYPDVGFVGMDPALHFLRYGRLLRRSPGLDFDSVFVWKPMAILSAAEKIRCLCICGPKDGRAGRPMPPR